MLYKILGLSLFFSLLFGCQRKHSVSQIVLVDAVSPAQLIVNSSSEIVDSQQSNCSSGMVEINGYYCPDVIQNCIDIDKSLHNVNGYVRCLEFAPTQCLTRDDKKIHMHFCIDKYEASDKKGDIAPVMISWITAKSLCESQDKRLCYDNEWTLACEGPEIYPYPYGLKRESSYCNIDLLQRSGFDASKSKMDPKTIAWLDQRVPSGSMEKCVSPYGVFDMTGNVDEATINSSGKPYKNALKGGHWVRGARNRCRPATIAHNEYFSNYESSYRCCSDISEIH